MPVKHSFYFTTMLEKVYSASQRGLLSFILCATAAAAWAQSLPFKHLTVEDGLSQNTITDVKQDALGMLWVGTLNGLNRYNGYEFETFESNVDDPFTLPSNFINCLEVGTDHTLWVGTKRGLCHWDQTLGRFTRMNNYFLSDSLNGQYDIGDILVDSEGGIWVMGEDKGFHIFYRKKNETHFRKLLALKNPPGNNVGFYGQMMEDLSGNVWVGTSRFGLWIFNKSDKAITHLALNTKENHPITSLLQDKKEKIWVGTLMGLFMSADKGNSFLPVKNLQNKIIRSLYQDRQKRMWVGTDDSGLLLYNDTEKKFNVFDHTISDPTSLLHNSVRCVLLDHQNILWVGTYAGGLSYHDPHTNAFRKYQSGTSNQNLSDNSITGFAENKSGNIWVATDRGGLNLFDPQTKIFRYFRADKNNAASIRSDIIQHIQTSFDGNLWIGHWAEGLDYYDNKSQRFYHYTRHPGQPGGLLSNSINYILEDSKRNLWLATDVGLHFADGHQTGKSIPPPLHFKVFKHDAVNPESISDSFVKTIFEDKKGRIWIGTWEGLNLWNDKASTFFNFKNNPNHLKLFTKDYILCIGQGEALNMLLGTNENGLLYYVQNTDSVIHFNKQNGFPSNTVVGMQQDHHGVWWISTTNGLVRFNEKDFSFSPYNRHDGLPSNEFRFNASGKLSNGKLLFGGNNGFTVFHPDSVKTNLIPPKVSITQFKIFNKLIKASDESVLSKDISLTDKITIPYHQSSLGFQFVAINFTASSKNSYAYQLEGIDKNWNYIGSQRTANFSFIPPGEYILKIKAANNDGVWSAPIKLSLVITPPWWGTVWFKVSGLFIIVGMLVLFYRIRTKQLYNKKKLLEVMVSERTLELEHKNNLLSERQKEIIQQKEELLIQRDHVNQQFQTIQTLSEIGQKITASLKKEELIFQLYTILEKLMDVAHFSIGHLDAEKRIIEFSLLKKHQSQIEETVVTLDEDRFSVLCIEQKKEIRINDFKNEYAAYFHDNHNRYAEGYASAVYVPLFLTEGSITGILVVKSFQTNAYSDVHLNTLKNLGAYIGIAFENANVYKDIEAQSQLLQRQSQKLEEFDKIKTRFFINISHEFRTPLTLIITPLEHMISQGSLDWPRMQRQLSVMHKNAKELLHLINELLEIRNLESTGTRKIAASELDLVVFTKTVMSRFEELAKHLNINLTVHHEQEKILVWFDPDIMQKVLSNLYSNAFKYTTQCGSVETNVRICPQSSEHVIIQISDTGVGITASELPFVFERFYQGDAPVNPIQQSSGIGLSLIKDLLTLHSGNISVVSEEGMGTTFTITLPLGKKHLDLQQLQVQPDDAKVTHSYLSESDHNDQQILQDESNELPQILIVEDNEDVRELLRIELESEFVIYEAQDGKRGIETCFQYIPDLVLSDVMMPVTDGISLCDVLKNDERTSHIPIILLTAKIGENSQIQGLKIGADDYIAKPFNIKVLRARIHNLITSRKKLHSIFSSKEKIKTKVIDNIKDRNFIEKIDVEILKHIKNPELNHEILSKEVGMSKTQLYRKLQSITGKTVHEYIRNHRLRSAYELLTENPDNLVSEVAYEVGFKDPSYFSKSFYAFYNVWPISLKKSDPIN